MGVFDGMGGAGAARTAGEHSYTEAYRASRILRASLLRDMSQLIPDALRIGRSKAIGTAEMAKRLSDDLVEVSKKPGLISTSRIRGTMTKTLPSTVATVEIKFDDVPAGSIRLFVVKLRAMWAGDSRVWVLTPSRGLQQISKDDVDIEDCLEQIRQDPPMNNVASASVPFHLNEHEVSVNEPCIVIVATDGVFGYVRSPGEVELLILRAMANSSGNDASVARNLFEEFRSIAKDDASAAIFACGFDSLIDCIDAFNLRKNKLTDQYSALDRIEEADAVSDAIEKQWAIERISYTSLMPGAV
jgi:serine/threonine protein phosphatase PrpC